MNWNYKERKNCWKTCLDIKKTEGKKKKINLFSWQQICLKINVFEYFFP